MRNYEILTSISAMIYATDRKKLWAYRNICEEIGQEENVRLQPTLICDLGAVVRISQFLPKGIDVFISEQRIKEGIFLQIKGNILKNQPQAHFIVGSDEVCSLADTLRKTVSDIHRQKTLIRSNE